MTETPEALPDLRELLQRMVDETEAAGRPSWSTVRSARAVLIDGNPPTGSAAGGNEGKTDAV